MEKGSEGKLRHSTRQPLTQCDAHDTGTESEGSEEPRATPEL